MTKEKEDVDSVAVLKIYIKRTPKGVLFYLTGDFSEITCQIKISPRDAQLAAEKFALRHRLRAKCVRAHTFLCLKYVDITYEARSRR